MPTEIKEAIKVMAVFDKEMVPVKFRWKGRVYPVKEVTYTWKSREGDASIVHFSVTDGATLYELSYNQSTMKWTIEEAGGW